MTELPDDDFDCPLLVPAVLFGAATVLCAGLADWDCWAVLESGVSLYELAGLDAVLEVELVLLDVLALCVELLDVLDDDLCVELELLAEAVLLVPDLGLAVLVVLELVFGAEL